MNQYQNTDLRCGKILAIPSYHNHPQFARIVREQFEIFKPDIVAVEYPDNIKNALKRGVEWLPQMSALITPLSEVIAITPEDSMIEAVRCALEKGIPFALIDLDIEHQRDVQPVFDPNHLEIMALDEFVALNRDRIDQSAGNKSFRLREEHMASHLQRLSARFERILFVCGMVHWPRIRQRLAAENSLYAHRSRPGGDLALLTPEKYILLTSGANPYRAAFYEQSRSGGGFSFSAWLSGLFLNAAQRCEKTLSLTEMDLLIRYSRNLALVNGGLELHPYLILEVAGAIVDPVFESKVWEAMLDSQHEETAQRYAGSLEIAGETMTFCHHGRQRRRVMVRRHRSAENRRHPVPARPATLTARRTGDRAHPNAALLQNIDDLVLRDSWGRYTDEMEEEERFIAALERSWNHVNFQDEHNVEEFSGGLMDGLDIRETFYRRSEDKWFVVEYPRREPRFAMVMVEFADDSSFNLPIYTYGTHKGLAFCTPESHPPEEARVASMEFGQLLSFKRLIDKSRLDILYGELWQRWREADAESDGFSPRLALTELAFGLAGEGDILIVAPRASHQFYRQQAMQKGINFYFLEKEKIWNPSFDRIQKFHVYYHLYS